METPQRVIDRVLDNIDVIGNCWVSRYSGPHGYARVGWSTAGKHRMALVHRVAYEHYHGPIPGDMTVDHTCKTRACINPAHLRLLTASENSADNGNAYKTHCPKGHPYSPENTYFNKRGCRVCRRCSIDRVLARRKQTKQPFRTDG